MMISPETYYEFHLKNKDINQVITAIRGLKQEIGRLKKLSLNTDFIIISPSYSTRIYWIREYLKKAKETFIKMGGEYIPSKNELKSIKFNENIENIDKIFFETGSYSEDYRYYSINLQNTTLEVCLKYQQDIESKQYEIELDKENFLKALSNLYMGEWKKNYVDKDNLDGVQWSIEIHYQNDIKTTKFIGNNDFPYNFDEFEILFEK